MYRHPRHGEPGAIFAFLLTIVLSGCHAGSHSAKSQVVAKVNGHDITVMQLNQALQGMNPDSLTPEIKKKAIDSVIDEELLVQESQSQKFDRDPGTVAAIEHARRQVLAQTFAARRVLPRLPVQQTEEEKYYRKNPALFEQRKLYKLTVYTIKDSDLTAATRAELGKLNDSNEVRNTLDKRGTKYLVQQLTSPAEDLPIDKLSQFAAAKPGDLLIAWRPPSQTLLITMMGWEEQPMSFETARPVISAYLTKSRNTQVLEEHLKSQRAIATISYVGDFAGYGRVASK